MCVRVFGWRETFRLILCRTQFCATNFAISGKRCVLGTLTSNVGRHHLTSSQASPRQFRTPKQINIILPLTSCCAVFPCLLLFSPAHSSRLKLSIVGITFHPRASHPRFVTTTNITVLSLATLTFCETLLRQN